jgi:F-type H+-transporting ATPase subunit a
LKKRKLLGCSFPAFIIITIILLALFVFGLISGPIGASLFKNVTLPSWMHISQPHPILPAERLFFNSPLLTNSIISTWLTIIVIVTLVFFATRRIKLIPGKLQNFVEFIFESLYNFCTSVAGEKARSFLPIVSTIFLMVIFNAWIALLPFFGAVRVPGYEYKEGIWEHMMVPLFRSANTDINLPLALAIASFAAVTYFGIRARKGEYVAQFFNFGPLLKNTGKVFKKEKGGALGLFLGFVNVIVGFLELMGQLTRIISFTFRLFGNMIAGEILILLFSFLLPYLIPLPFYGLELLVGFVQALIFGGLTLVFMSVAVTSHESEHG